MIILENYYQVLGIEMDAGEKEIKRAYMKMLRKHPPEKDEEGFKKIREAYETLSNHKSRAEYDAILKYKDEIEEYMIYGQVAIEEENFMEAVKYFKKILVIEPSLSYARNMLGLAFSYNGDYQQAIEQFKRLIKEDSKNSAYLFNMAMAHMGLENYRVAKDYLIKAYQENKINSDVVLALVNIHINDKQYGEAVRLLREAIELDGEVDFQDQIYFFKLLEVYIIEGDIEQAKDILKEIESITPNDDDVRNYVIWRVSKLAAELYDLQRYEYAKILSAWALKLDPYNEAVKDLHNSSTHLYELYKQCNMFQNDYDILKPLKGIVSLWLTNDNDISEYEREEYFNDFMRQLEYKYNEDILKSVRRIKRKYKKVYDLNTEFFNGLEKALDTQNNNLGGSYSSDSNTNTNGNGGSGNCFVATAAYGTPWAKEINLLRKWRDKKLKVSYYGSYFICFYNKVGPIAANIIRKNKLLMAATRLLIKGLIKLLKIGR